MKFIKVFGICTVIFSAGHLACYFFHWDTYLTAFIAGALYYSVLDNLMDVNKED